MSNKITLVESSYDKEGGRSSVLISTPIGLFNGETYIKGTDVDSPSSFFGCEIAALKAQKKYLKRKISNLKQQLIGIQLLYSQSPNNKMLITTVDRLKSEINNQIENIKKQYKEIERLLHNKPKEREQALIKFKNLKQRKETTCE